MELYRSYPPEELETGQVHARALAPFENPTPLDRPHKWG